MGYDRWHRYKTDLGNLIKTSDQFREYISSKSPITRNMLEIFDELLEGKEVYFRVNPKNVILNERDSYNIHEWRSNTIIPLPSLLKKKHLYPVALRPGLMIGISKERCKMFDKTCGKFNIIETETVYIDTGYAKITEGGEVLRSKRGWRFDWEGLGGLENVKQEAERAIKIYKKIFHPREPSNKEG